MGELIRLAGFDEDEWREADQFAQNVAAALGIEYVGEVGEVNHEILEWEDED